MYNSEYWDKTILPPAVIPPAASPNLPISLPKSQSKKNLYNSEKTQYYDPSQTLFKTLGENSNNLEKTQNIFSESRPFRTFVRNLRKEEYEAKEFSSGQRIGKYIINKFIGEGNFSKIYEAKHIYLNNSVALKTLFKPRSYPPEIFLREAQALAILSHENIVKVFDADIYDGIPCIVLEHLNGKTLRETLNKHQQLTIERTLDLLEQIGSVLVRQEEKQILHLDIKPTNIFIRPNGSFCLFDYGLVGIGEDELGSKSNSGFVVGTPAYMAPEQLNGKADRRSDLFSLGLTAWECLVGQSARKISDFTVINKDEDVINVPIKHLNELHGDFPNELSEIISHLTALSPDNRYDTAKDFVDDLNEFRYRSKTPQGPTKEIAFIAIPFSLGFNQVFNTISNTTKILNLKARRLDQHIFFGRDIWSQCVQEIEIAKVVIADFSGIKPFNVPNPNVVTEASYARAINKNLIIIKQGDPDSIPFNWRSIPIISYENTPDGLNKLESELLIRLKKVMES